MGKSAKGSRRPRQRNRAHGHGNSADSYGMRAYPGFLTWMDYEYDEGVREHLGLPSLHKPSTAGAVSRPSFEKIRSAIDHEKDHGAWIDNLRPGERYRRLEERWKLMGYKNSEIPNIRTVREYFNRGPGKVEGSA